MKNPFRFVLALFFIASFAASASSQIRQTALYIDNGFGAFTKLTATGAGGTLNLPSSGTLASTSTVWSLTGNTGTTPGTDFIGTTDNVALEFKTGGTIAGWIDAYGTNYNTGLGFGVLQTVTGAGKNNTAIGYYAGLQLTTGAFNTAIGSSALYTVKTSNSNTAIGTYAMQNSVDGSANNTALGTAALASSSTYTQCTALGDGSNVTGGFTDATAIGYDAAAAASYTIQLGNANVTNVNTSGALQSGAISSASIPATGGLSLANASSANLTTIEAGNATAAVTYVLPTAAPSANQVLTVSSYSAPNATLSWGSGNSGLGAYAYVYQIASPGETVSAGSDATFSTNGPLSNITHTAGASGITVSNAGTYEIDYSVVGGGSASAISIAVNGTVDASTPIEVLSGADDIHGTAILTLSAGDVITLRNDSSTTLQLIASTTIVGAQLVLKKLN